MTDARESLFASDRWGNNGEILDACCGGRHWWWDKEHPLAIYMDERICPKGSVDVRPNWECRPDLIADFRAMPFKDETFQLVLFDPPHIVREQPTGYMAMKYGALSPETEQDELRSGFNECWRVLAPGGTLVFKWGAGSIKRVEAHFPATPIVGTRSPRGGQTRWFIFYKPMTVPTAEYLALVELAEAAHDNAENHNPVSHRLRDALAQFDFEATG